MAWKTRDYTAARKYHEQALAIRREVLGEKHADTASSLFNLGLVAEDMRDYVTARKHHEQALAIQRELFREKHADTADSLNNLGLVADDAGDHAAGESTTNRRWRFAVRSLGKSTPTPLTRYPTWAW